MRQLLAGGSTALNLGPVESGSPSSVKESLLREFRLIRLETGCLETHNCREVSLTAIAFIKTRRVPRLSIEPSVSLDRGRG